MRHTLALPPKFGNVSAPELCDIIAATRCDLSIEARTQADLYCALRDALPELAAGMARELRLSERERVDIWANGVVIEVKLKGKHRAFDVYRQLCRYAEYAEVEAIILATTMTMALPDRIAGKPAYLQSLGRAWL